MKSEKDEGQEVVVGELRYSKYVWLRVTLSYFRGKPYVHVRQWKSDGEKLCRGKGIGLRPDVIKKVRRMLREALKRLPAEYR
jgi:hypothetical protein